jgi:hypothetical protein
MSSSNPKIDAALEVLRKAGHNVRNAVVKDGEIHVEVDGVPRTYDQIVEWAEDEKNRKPGKLTGQYVRLVVAPRTRMGTLGNCETYHGQLRYILDFDRRFRILPMGQKMWVHEGEIEICDRPSDAEVERINRLGEHSG